MTAPFGRTVVCGFCAQGFEEDRGQPACRRCPIVGSCHLVRCPFCGYENPVPVRWLDELRQLVSRHEPD